MTMGSISLTTAPRAASWPHSPVILVTYQFDQQTSDNIFWWPSRIILFERGKMSAEGSDPVQMAVVELLGMSDMYRRYYLLIEYKILPFLFVSWLIASVEAEARRGI